MANLTNITIPPVSVPAGTDPLSTLATVSIGLAVPLALALLAYGIHALLVHFHVAGVINLPGLPVSAITAAAQDAAAAAIAKRSLDGVDVKK